MIYDRIVTAIPYVSKRTRLKFITHFYWSMIIGALISVGIFYLYTYRELGNSHYEVLSRLLKLRQNILPAMVFAGVIAGIFAGLAVLLITLINSNRIAGPIYRLEKSLESIGNGDFRIRARFRRHDAIYGLADEINSVSDCLNENISDISKKMKEIRGEVERLREKPDQSTAILLEKVRLAGKKVSEFNTEKAGAL